MHLKLLKLFKTRILRHPYCPICSSLHFRDFRGRTRAQCANCKSLERGRLLWLMIKKTKCLSETSRILHIAPEDFLLKKFHQIGAQKYYPCDFNPIRYKNDLFKIEKFDYCHDVYKMNSESWDVIIHNHVLEHIPCSYEAALTHTIRALAPGGWLFFSVPFKRGFYDEDLNPLLSKSDRIRRFHQEDHYRIFGTEDFEEKMLEIFPINIVSLSRKYMKKRELLQGNIPEETLTELTSHNIFCFNKPLQECLEKKY